jgi:selenocysteine lyase/cysteine desulfurase
MTPDWQSVREQFPVLRDWTYLNTATFGPVPRCACEAMERHHRRRDELACLDFLDWFDDADRVRALAARLVGAQPADIAFTPSTGVALGWLVAGIDWKPGDRVVALEGEFPNNTYYGHALARRGADFVEVPLPGGGFSLDQFASFLSRRTRLVLMSTVNYATGLRPPVGEIGKLLRERGILFYVDATQSLGALPTDVNEIGADVLAAHGYKWLCAPAGIGLVYIRPEVRQWLQPSIYSWRSHCDWRRVDALHHGPPELPPEALRYEGGLLNFPGVYALGAILDLILSLGPDRIEQRVQHLAAYGRDVLRRSGAILADHNSPLLAARFPGRDVSCLAGRCASPRISSTRRPTSTVWRRSYEEPRSALVRGRLSVPGHGHQLRRSPDSLGARPRSHRGAPHLEPRILLHGAGVSDPLHLHVHLRRNPH